MNFNKLAALAKEAALIALACVIAGSEFYLIVVTCFPCGYRS